MKKWVFIWLLLFPANVLAVEFPEIQGWKSQGEVNIYRKADLWQYIDGGAELFLMYDFQMLRFREFSKGDMEMTVEIYDMGSPLNAFGIYTTERGDGVKGLPIGTEAVVVLPDYCQLLKDRFYVKVKMYQGDLDRVTAEAILKSIDSFIEGAPDFPDELKLLPDRGKISGTEKYITEGYMGLGELNHILIADYQDGKGEKCRYFLILPSADETIDVKWQQLSAKWRSISEKGQTILYRDIPYEGKIGIIRQGKKITGVSGVAEMNDLLKYLTNIL